MNNNVSSNESFSDQFTLDEVFCISSLVQSPRTRFMTDMNNFDDELVKSIKLKLVNFISSHDKKELINLIESKAVSQPTSPSSAKKTEKTTSSSVAVDNKKKDKIDKYTTPQAVSKSVVVKNCA